MIVSTLKKTFNSKLFFIFAVLAIFFFLVIGMPNPPGLLYKASEKYLQSHPGYHDIKTGSINPALLEQNVDTYNSYLLSVVIIIIANLLAYYFLFVLANVVAWNYILHKTISVANYWKSFLFNLLWLLLAAFIGILSYGAFTFVGSVGPIWWNNLMSFVFALTLAILVVFTMLLNYYVHKMSVILDAFVPALRSLKDNFLRLIVGVLIMFVAIVIVSMLFYIPSMSFNLVTALVALTQIIGIAWLHLYVFSLIDQKESHKKVK